MRFGTPGVVKLKSKFEMNGKQTGNGERTVGGCLRRLRLVNGRDASFFFPPFFWYFTSYILAYIRMYTRTRTKLLLLLLWILEEKEGEEGLCQQGRVFVYIYDVEFWECSRVLPTHGKNSLPRPSCRPR